MSAEPLMSAASTVDSKAARRRPVIGIFGAGCIGLYVGARIQLSGSADVLFIGRQRMQSILKQNGGLKISASFGGDNDESDARLSAIKIPFDELKWSNDVKSLIDEKVDYVIVTVKCEATSTTANDFGGLPIATPIISLQNGVRNTEVLSRALPHSVLGAMVGYNVAEIVAGEFVQTTAGKLCFDERVGSRFQSILQRAFRQFTSEVPIVLYSANDLKAVQFGKLLINCTNAVNALAGIPTAEMLLQREYRNVIAAIQSEGVAVYNALNIRSISGLPLPIPRGWVPTILRWPTSLYRIVSKRSLRMDKRAKLSMAQDLDARRPKTEIDDLNGFIVELGRTAAVPTPVNAKIWYHSCRTPSVVSFTD